jgi:hypothetical protein
MGYPIIIRFRVGLKPPGKRLPVRGTLLGGAVVAWPVLAHAQQGDRVRGPGQARPGPVARGSHGLIRCHA